MGALGDRWGVLIVRDLFLGLARYDDLRRSTGITNATLSDRLRALEQNGLIERRKYQSRPDRYEYVLTKRGVDVAFVLLAMMQVGDKWNLAALEGPPLRFIDAGSGRQVKLGIVDAETGERVDPGYMKVEAGPGADDLTRWRISAHGDLAPKRDRLS
jgi:DNA-binding HxlR family transcriptional regulator